MREILEQQREEELGYIREHPEYFVETYCRIEDKDTGRQIPFLLWEKQRRALREIHGHRFSIILKARQMGITWMVLAYALYTMMCGEGRTIVALSRTEVEAKELARRMGVLIRHMPEYFGQSALGEPFFESQLWTMGAKIGRKGSEASIFQAFTSAPGSSRSFTANLLIFDEWAYQQHAEEIWASGLPVINRPTGGKVIGLSTMAPGSFFEKIWKNSREFHRIFLPWDSDPRRDRAWYERTRRLLGERIYGEYPASPEEAMRAARGAFFGEFRRHIHVMNPFAIPKDWRRYHTIDYGLDMLASYWVAFDNEDNAYVYREVYEANLTIPEAAERMKEAEAGEEIYTRYAPPDIFGRSQESGRARSDIFADYGMSFEKSDNNRTAGWANLQDWLRIQEDGEGRKTAKLRIFSCCENLIRTLAAIPRDSKIPGDCAREPHELTHAPDALRYLFVLRPCGGGGMPDPETEGYYDQVEDMLEYGCR